jgi:hypothetical protein
MKHVYKSLISKSSGKRQLGNTYLLLGKVVYVLFSLLYTIQILSSFAKLLTHLLNITLVLGNKTVSLNHIV